MSRNAELHVHVPNLANPTIPRYIITAINQNTFNPNPPKSAYLCFFGRFWLTHIDNKHRAKTGHLTFPRISPLSIGGVDPEVRFG